MLIARRWYAGGHASVLKNIESQCHLHVLITACAVYSHGIRNPTLLSAIVSITAKIYFRTFNRPTTFKYIALILVNIKQF